MNEPTDAELYRSEFAAHLAALFGYALLRDEPGWEAFGMRWLSGDPENLQREFDAVMLVAWRLIKQRGRELPVEGVKAYVELGQHLVILGDVDAVDLWDAIRERPVVTWQADLGLLGLQLRDLTGDGPVERRRAASAAEIALHDLWRAVGY